VAVASDAPGKESERGDAENSDEDDHADYDEDGLERAASA
jgi:hypothetical protein